MSDPGPARKSGAYGLAIDGLPEALPFFSPVADDAPTLTVLRAVGDPGADERFDEEGAVLRLAGGQGTVALDRASLTASFNLTEDFADEAVLHPFMSGCAAVVNRWLGRDAFHSGAFLADGGAWCLIGDKGQGKSSTLGFLASQGVGILTDDLLIVDDGQALAGPAFVDLRPDAAAALGVGRDMGLLGARMRFRITVPTPPPRTPLLGWITLGWADEVELVKVPVDQRLKLLFDNRAVWRNPPNAATFVRYAALPMWELRRPKDWSSLPQTLALLTANLPG